MKIIFIQRYLMLKFPSSSLIVLKYQNILITGGTSGLGKSMVNAFLNNGNSVVAIGRNSNEEYKNQQYKKYISNFASLVDIRNLVDKFEHEKITFDLLINNAGVLSSPSFERTTDGFEYSYQVNFLSHVLLTRLLLRKSLLNDGLIVNISSPIHKIGKLPVNNHQDRPEYRMFQIYSNTKLYMALFSQKLTEEGQLSFSFNPGTFRSGIYRQQKKWFHKMYRIASPILIPSEKVALALYNIIINDNWSNGEMINKKARINHLNSFDPQKISEFWMMVDRQIESYLI